MIKAEEGTNGNSFVTLGRGEFEMLCSKLNGLENSIAELRHEISRNSAVDPSITRHESHATSGVTRMNGHHRKENAPTHTDVHGIHTRNEAGEIVHLGGGSIPAMLYACLLYTSPSPRDGLLSRMPSSA